MEFKYYEVVTKCGHVGRNRYYEGHFFVKAISAGQASKMIRRVPRVKHNHDDAILSVSEITHQQYVKGCIEKLDEVYFKCRNKKEQREHWEEIESFVRFESDARIDKLREKQSKGRKGIRNLRKYIKMNLHQNSKYGLLQEYDYIYA